MTVYPGLRRIHLLAGLFAAAMLLMYGVSAVQMAHPAWVRLRPAVREWRADLAPGIDSGRDVARELHARGARGELSDVSRTPRGWSLTIGLPGTEHRVTYRRETGAAEIKTSTRGFLGRLNRLHHAAGFWHESRWMKLWAAMVALASLAVLLMGATGLWMWFARRQDRVFGALLLAANLAFALTVLALLRQAGP
jgi:hypothetical protein